MSKIEVNKIGPQCGTTLTVGCGAGQTVVADAATVTLGRCGGTVALASGATQTGFGRTGTVDWDTTPKTATFTAVSGDGFFANTTGSAFNMNLPAGVAGAIVSVADYAGTWNSNNLTVVPNGTDKIGGVGSDVILDTKGQSVTFIFVDSTQGWINTMDSTSNERGNAFIIATGGTVTTVCTNFKVHTFTGPGTFCVSSAGSPAGSNTVDYLVIAGGASGGGGSGGGGGGAGGYRESPGTASGCYSVSPRGASPAVALPVSIQGYPITVGAGGASLICSPVSGNAGVNSIFSTITSAGGGGGGGENIPSKNGQAGGSGGGGHGNTSAGSGGAGNTPSVSPAQGSTGGAGGGQYAGGGGGGATGAGTQSNDPAGVGGAGATSSINGTPTARAGGGGGGNQPPAGNGPGPGTNGGGNGGVYLGVAATNGTANTGGGGGGNGFTPGSPPGVSGAGGSGIVIIRYKFQ